MVFLKHEVEFVPFHKTIGAEVRGVDFSKPVADEVLGQIKAGLVKYAVLVFRDTKMEDEEFADFSELFGELCQNQPSRRFACPRLGDPSNIYLDGTLVQKGDLRWYLAKETALFHTDGSYDARRIRYTSIIARECPPLESGGPTEFADTRTAYDDLDDETKRFLDGKVAAYSHFQSRKAALPDFPTFKALEPKDYPMGRHHVVVDNQGSNRKNLYVASHMHHIEGMDEKESAELISKLTKHASQDKYVAQVFYNQPGDVVIWDNTAVIHRAGKGTWSGKYRRDIRRCTMFDNTPQEWGVNDKSMPRFLAGPVIQAKHEEIYGKEGKVYDFDEV